LNTALRSLQQNSNPRCLVTWRANDIPAEFVKRFNKHSKRVLNILKAQNFLGNRVCRGVFFKKNLSGISQRISHAYELRAEKDGLTFDYGSSADNYRLARVYSQNSLTPKLALLEALQAQRAAIEVELGFASRLVEAEKRKQSDQAYDCIPFIVLANDISRAGERRQQAAEAYLDAGKPQQALVCLEKAYEDFGLAITVHSRHLGNQSGIIESLDFKRHEVKTRADSLAAELQSSNPSRPPNIQVQFISAASSPYG